MNKIYLYVGLYGGIFLYFIANDSNYSFLIRLIAISLSLSLISFYIFFSFRNVKNMNTLYKSLYVFLGITFGIVIFLKMIEIITAA